MKKLLVLTSIIVLSSCGFGHRISKDCGGSFSDLCKGIFGDVAEENDNQQTEINALKSQLEATITQNISQIAVVQSLLDAQQQQITLIQLTLNDLQTQISLIEQNQTTLSSLTQQLQVQLQTLSTVDNTLTVQQTSLQTQVNSLLVQLVTLNGYTHIVDLVDPCGNGPGFDEVLIKTTQGYVAYFESGSTRFLSLLTPGAYQTTDSQRCNFTVLGNGNLQF